LNIYLKKFQQKNICIVTLYTKNIESYSKLTEKINKKYANDNNYDFIVFKERFSNDRAPQWDKLKAIQKCLELGYKYVFWIDSDAYFNKNIRLETFLKDEKEFYICEDLKNSDNKCLINTGTMLIKNTNYIKLFLEKWWESYDKEYLFKPYHEQTILDNIIKNNYFNIKEKIQIYPDYTFNCYFNDVYNKNTRDNLFVVHMMATSEDIRVKIAKEKCNELNI
jgi:hypothetical protein